MGITKGSVTGRIDEAVNMALSLDDLVEKALEEDRLSYISPEQTGKLNVDMDYRSSFYSFGIILYKFFTGRFPFTHDDGMKVIYDHIAVVPEPLVSLNPDIEPLLSDLVDKLLSKNPDDRYQSHEGIIFDLRQIASGTDEAFVLGSHDITNRLQIPDTLYGRDKQIETITRAVTEHNSEMVVVSGEPGMGKSALIEAVIRDTQSRDLFFAHTKFEQHRTNQTFNAVSQALSQYVKMVILSGEAQMEKFKQALSQNLGENLGLMIEFIPGMESLFKSKYTLDVLQPFETQNRFNITFLKLMHTIASFDRRLVIFIDDMQWCDLATTTLLELIMGDPDITNIGIILSYRENEVDQTHPFSAILRLYEDQRNVIRLGLDPLDIEQIDRMMGDLLQRTGTETRELSRHLLRKTNGNPFFLKELLYCLHGEGLIVFNPETRMWEWDIAEIIQVQISDNVVELVSQTIDKIPTGVKDILRHAAMLGSEFNIDDLAKILGKEGGPLNEQLLKSLQLNFVVPSGDGHYQFVHDKIQEAFNRYIRPSEREEFHLKAGEYFQSKAGDSKENLLRITAHLNQAKNRITSPGKRKELLELNHRCAKLSIASNAYTNAVHFVREAISLQGPGRWEDDYRTTLELNTLLAEAGFLNLDFETTQNVFDDTMAHAGELNEKTAIVQIEIFSRIAQNKMKQALDLGLEVLSAFGIELPVEDDPLVYYPQLFELYDVNKISELVKLPQMQDKVKLSIINILNSIMSPAYLTAPEKYPKICYVAVELCIKHGNSPASTNVYAVHALLLSGVFSEFKHSHDFARLAQQLIETYDAKAYIPKVEMIANACVQHWNDHIETTLTPMQQTTLRGIELGDFEYSCYSGMYHSLYSFLSGKPIAPLKQMYEKQARQMRALKQSYQFLYSSLWQQVLENLTRPVENPTVLEGRFFSEKASTKDLVEAGSASILYNLYFSKAFLGLLFEDDEAAFSAIQEAGRYHAGVAGLYQFSELYFYDALISYRRFENTKAISKDEITKVLTNAISYYEKLWKTAPQNVAHKLTLLKALKGDLDEEPKSWKQFEVAAEQAGQNGFKHIEAIIHLFGFYYWEKEGMTAFSSTYLENAHACFKSWGAKEVSHSLLKQYGRGVEKESQKREFTLDQHDLVSVLKASQTLAMELSLEQLLNKIMEIIIENSGSQTGLLYLEDDNGLKLVAGYQNEGFTTSIADDALPTRIIHYVSRTKQEVIYSAGQPNELIEFDAYIQGAKPKSMFCSPIRYQGEFRGVLYLENRSTLNLYSKDKIELLQFLSTQAAISLEHAKLFEQINTANITLEKQVEDRTREIGAQKQRAESALEVLQQTQNQLIQNEKMAALGQLIAGIAHEINTPIGAIKSSSDNISHAILQTLEDLPQLILKLNEGDNALFIELVLNQDATGTVLTSRQERSLTRELVGKLDAANIPDSRRVAADLIFLNKFKGWETFTSLLLHPERDYIFQSAYNIASAMRNTVNISHSVNRISKIIFALKSFSHFDSTGEMKTINLQESIETVLIIYNNQIKQGIELSCEFDPIPQIMGYPDELTQVWTNVIHNALQAMDYSGSLTLGIKANAHGALVSVTDTGCGIPEEIKNKIFTPFFTTKAQGEGSGLGLDIVKKIIDKHGGSIDIDSRINRGTTVNIHLPYNKPENKE